MPRIRFKLNPHDGQLHIINNKRRFNHIRCHRRFGKSVLNYGLLIETASRGLPAAYVTPTAEDYSKRWAEFVQAAAPVIQTVRQQEGQVVLKNGGSVYFHGMHRYDGMRGNHYGRVIIDEAAHSPYLKDAWEMVISPTLADLEGDAWFTTTPNARQKERAFQELEKRHKQDDDWAFFHIPVTSPLRNPILKQAEIERQKATLPSIVWQQEWLAEYVDMEGSRVKREWLQWFDRNPMDMQITMGVDLAISTKTEADYTSCAVVGKAPDGILYVLDVQRTQQSYHGVLNFIQAMAQRWQPQTIGIEQVQYQKAVVDELILRGLPVQGITPTKDKVARFMNTEGRIEHGLMKFSRHLPTTFTDELLTFPHGEHDDQVDALVYAADLLSHQFFAFTL